MRQIAPIVRTFRYFDSTMSAALAAEQEIWTGFAPRESFIDLVDQAFLALPHSLELSAEG